MYSLLLFDDARRDVIEAFLWYENQKEGLGVTFELYLDKALIALQRNPLLDQVKYDSIRICYLEKFPYGIHYLVDEMMVRVFGILHTSKNPSDWFKRFQ